MAEIKSIMNQWGKEHTPFVFLLDFELKKPMCWKWADTENIFQFNFDGVTNQKNINTDKVSSHKSAFEFNKTPISFEAYKSKFDDVKKEIEIGNSFLVNLTAKTKLNSNYTIAEIFNGANAKYTCYLKDEFVCFSPETFVKINDGKIYSYPMKGTINASIPDAKNILLQNQKEISKLEKDYGGAKCPKFNLVGPVEWNNLELAQKIARAQNKELKYQMVDFHTSRPGHDLRYALDGDLMKELGWVPKVSIEERINQVVRWTLNNDRWLKL